MHSLLSIAIAVTTVSLLFCYGSGNKASGKSKQTKDFEIVYSWDNINYTWPQGTYDAAVQSGVYIPSNNGFSGIRTYQNVIFLTIPRFSNGTPVTLATFRVDSPRENPLLEPYPSWEFNVGRSCETLQNVQQVEIDTKGVMWVVDGNRFIQGLTNCPPKLVLLDLNAGGKVIHSYTFPNNVSLFQGTWLNDIVIDEIDGGYAYIPDVSDQDPGIVVYSRKQNRSWKLRHCSVFAEFNAIGYTVHGIQVNTPYNIDGIALSPPSKSCNGERTFYYTALTGYSLYSISTSILKNESYSATSWWRRYVQYVGTKPDNCDGMIIDSQGYLYFGLLSKDAVGRWNIFKGNFDKNYEIIYQNSKIIDWPDAFAIDGYGNLYVTVDETERILNGSQFPPTSYPRLRVAKSHIGAKSYLY